MKHMYDILAVVILCVLSGCIRQEVADCPPLRIRLEVKDKNYFNIDAVESLTGLDRRVDENLSFSSYVSSIYYALYPQGEKAPCLVRHLYEPQEEAAIHELLFPQDLPFGNYALVVWGNINTEQGIAYDGKSHTYRLHDEHQEGYDVYMGCINLTYNESNADHVLRLERVKGKLLIEVEGMSEKVLRSYKEIDHLYEQVDARWQYTGNGQVHTWERWSQPQPHVLTDTYLSPTEEHVESQVLIKWMDDAESQTDIVQPAAVKMRMKRNEITVLRYVYNPEEEGFDIYLMINDGWLLIHDMGIEE